MTLTIEKEYNDVLEEIDNIVCEWEMIEDDSPREKQLEQILESILIKITPYIIYMNKGIDVDD